jgi:histidinol-phosphate aminotransferase
VAAELNKRQHPAPLSTLSAALALAGLAAPADVTPILEERERMRERLLELGFEPRESHANFLYVPVEDPQGEYDRLLARGLAVRPVRGGIRITIRTQQDDDRLLQSLQ